MKKIFQMLAAVLAATLLHHASGAELLETRPWPPATPCSACVTLQFGELEMHVPAALLGRVFAFPGAPGLHLLPRVHPEHSLVLMGTPSQDVIGKYPNVHCGTSVRQFFDMLGDAANNALAHKAEGVARAVRYTRASKGRLHVYWIEAAPGEAQYLQIVVDGSDTLYTLGGDVTPPWYDAVLAHLTIAGLP